MQISSVERYVHDGEIYLPGDLDNKVQVTLAPDPFSTRSEVLHVDPGETLLEILQSADVEARLYPFIKIYIEGELVHREYWHCIRPKGGTHVVVKAFPKGGNGKNPLRIILAIVILVIAYYVPALYGLYGEVIVGGLTVGHLATAAILIAGTLALNALFPPPTPKLGDLGRDAPRFFLSGARNELRPFQPIPKILGIHLEYPPLGALPYTEVVGDDQYLRMIFVWGYGPLQLDDLRIGETPIEEFEEVEIEHLQGMPGDPTTFTLYSNAVHEESLSIQLKQEDDWVLRVTQADTDEISIDVTFPRGLVEFNADGQRQVLQVVFQVQYSVVGAEDWKGQEQFIAAQIVLGFLLTNPDVTTRVDTLFIDGFTGEVFFSVGQPNFVENVFAGFHYSRKHYSKIRLADVIRRPGLNITDADITNFTRTGEEPFTDPFNDFWVTATSPTTKSVDVSSGTLLQQGFGVTGKSTAAVRTSYRWDVPTQAQYDVRIRRVTADPEEDFKGVMDSFWTALRSVTAEDPINFSGLTATAIRIRATDQLNGVVSRLNGIVSSIIPDWDSGTQTWKTRVTNNPASCFLETLRGRGNARALDGLNYSLYFNGSDHVDLGSDVPMSAGGVTIECWIKPDVQDAGNDRIVTYGDLINTGTWALGIQPSHQLFFRLEIGTGDEGPITVGNAVAGEWTHIAGTYDGTGIKLYQDGVLLATVNRPGVSIATGKLMKLGSNESGSSDFYDGHIREVRLWNYARSRNEINAAMKSRLIGTEEGLIGYWRVDEGSEVTIFDSTSGDSDGIVNGATWDLTPDPNGRIDFTSLQNWHEYCEAEGFAFNMVRDFVASVNDALKDIAATGRATPTLVDGKWGVIFDEEQTVPVQHFGPRNSSNFQGSKLFPDLPHAFRVIFLNEEKRYDEDERMVYDDGFDVNNATVIERLELMGVTDPGQIWKMGRYHIAQARLRPEEYTFTTDLEYLACNRGNLIHVAFDVVKWGVGTARVSVVNDNGTHVTSVVVDDGFPVELGKSYSARFRAADGTSILEAVSVTADADGLTDTLNFITLPLIGLGTAPEVGDLLMFGESGIESVELLVKAIRPKTELTAEVVCVDNSPALYQADTGTIPPFDSQISDAPGSSAPAVIAIDSDEDYLIQLPDGSWQTRIVMTLGFSSQRPVNAVSIQVRYRLSGTDEAYALADFPIRSSTISLVQVLDGESYNIQLRYILEDEEVGPWGAVIVHIVIGATDPPDDIEVLMRSRDVMTWSYPNPPPDFAGFRIKQAYGTSISWENATELHKGLIAETHFPLAPILVYGGTQSIYCKAVDVAGNESINEAKLILGLGDPLIDNILVTLDLDAADFPGTYVNGSVAGGEFRADGDGGLYLVDGGAAYLPVGSDPYLTTAYQEAQWVTQINVDSSYYPGHVVVDLTIVGQWYIEFREGGTTPLYINDEPDSNSYLPVGGDPYLPSFDFTGINYVPWPGRLSLESATSKGLELRTTLKGGDIRGVISNFDVIFDVEDETERIEDLSLLAAGTRVPITKTYRSIESVNITLQDDAGTAETVKLLDKDETLGPLLKAFDSTQTATTAVVDVTITGVKG